MTTYHFDCRFTTKLSATQPCSKSLDPCSLDLHPEGLLEPAPDPESGPQD